MQVLLRPLYFFFLDYQKVGSAERVGPFNFRFGGSGERIATNMAMV
jgi:hypothetical protein